MFVSFTFIPSTLDERKTLTKISTHKTSHNRSPKLAHTSDDKETGRKPSLKRQTTGYTEKSRLHDICHQTGAAFNHKANAIAKRAIQTTKSLMVKNQNDTWLALLILKSTPMTDIDKSPAELLCNRHLGTNIPMIQHASNLASCGFSVRTNDASFSSFSALQQED